MSPCADSDVLGALLANELPADERARVIDHAASCNRCRAVVALLFEDGSPTGPGNEPADVGGTQVGRYMLENRLGAGGMGVVYAATDSELHRRVAIKLLHHDHDGSAGSEGRERLLREARTLARLSHPNVVTVFDVGVHGDRLFLAMELVDGGNLNAWLDRAPRALGDIVDRMCEAGRGLAAAHAAGVVHRDVKPDNILVGADDRARMTDFGLARAGETARAVIASIPEISLTETHAVVGTPIYMAPEQLAGERADARSDQWSFCATLYEVVAGVRPFAARDIAARKAAIANGRLAEPAKGRRVPSWLRRIVLRGLRSDPGARWPSVAAIVEALVRGRGRRRRSVVIAASVVALAVGGIAVLGQRGGATEDPRRASMEGPDTRPGCDCPYSACTDHGCAGQCNAPSFSIGESVPGLDVPGVQEAVLGATLDGSTILYVTGRRCGIDRMMLARRVGSVFVPIDITDRIRARVGSDLVVTEGSATLTADGRSIITWSPDTKHFLRARLDGNDIVRVDGSEFAQLTPVLTGIQYVRHPVMSADQLSLYYVISDNVGNDLGPLNGIYASERTDVHQPFPPGHLMPGPIRYFNYVTGVSADNLTLFVASEYATRVLVRATTREVFAGPGWGMSVPHMYGWRAVPIASCARILTTDTPGGCEAEHIIYLDAIPR